MDDLLKDNPNIRSLCTIYSAKSDDTSDSTSDDNITETQTRFSEENIPNNKRKGKTNFSEIQEFLKEESQNQEKRYKESLERMEATHKEEMTLLKDIFGKKD